MTARYLFSVDLEDVRDQAIGGRVLPSRLIAATEAYLDLLQRHGAKGTFFVVGEVARAEPGLIRRIAAAGHEIACHSDRHIPLDAQSPASFRDDVERNLEALLAAGASDVRGYRAPCFSLTKQTAWAYAILAELGFTYSSSVLPAQNPLYGWPGFGRRPRYLDGILELPITLMPWAHAAVPMGGGLYLRALPEWVLRRAFATQRKSGDPLLGYLHPFDIDPAHPRIRFRDLSWPVSRLMHVGRSSTLRRIEMIAKQGFQFHAYGSHAAEVLAGSIAAGGQERFARG
jgi:polysaccharide deacetylase family protein (PEP-CTERM system associated)